MSDAASTRLTRFFDTHPSYRTSGFLPAEDPLPAFPEHSGLRLLDKAGSQLPDLLRDPGLRLHMRENFWPAHWFEYCVGPEYLSELRLYYVRLAFAASAYMHQLNQPTVTVLPRNIAIPLVHAAHLLARPPILSYDVYALYNWRRIDPDGPIVPDNLATIQNFMHLPDAHGINQETWFIVIHVAIEAIAAHILDALARFVKGESELNGVLYEMAETVHDMNRVQARIPEHMDPMVYYQTFRHYIQGFPEGTVYESERQVTFPLRGETGAQASIMPLLTAFLKIHHNPQSPMVQMLADMRNYMPAEHRALLALVDALPNIKHQASKRAWNSLIDAMIAFNERHAGNADRYIYQRTDNTTGTGGTPRGWLTDLIDERRAAKK